MSEERKTKGTSAPKCKICGTAHWFSEPHIFPGGKASALAKAKAVVDNPPATKRKNGKKRK